MIGLQSHSHLSVCSPRLSSGWVKRRELIGVLGAAAMWPRVARAQQAAMPVVGFLDSESPEGVEYLLRSFHAGLGDAGYVEGRNVTILHR